MTHLTISPDDETIRQMRELAELWGLPEIRHNTAVVSRCVERVWMLEIGTDRMKEEEKNSGSIDNTG